MSFDPTPSAPVPLEPAHQEPQPTLSPDPSETARAAPPSLSEDDMEPDQPPAPLAWPGDWPVATLGLLYVLGLALSLVIGGPGVLLLFGVLVGVLALDWRGYFSLRGWVPKRYPLAVRVLLGAIFVCLFAISLLIYFVRRFIGQPQEAI